MHTPLHTHQLIVIVVISDHLFLFLLLPDDICSPFSNGWMCNIILLENLGQHGGLFSMAMTTATPMVFPSEASFTTTTTTMQQYTENNNHPRLEIC